MFDLKISEVDAEWLRLNYSTLEIKRTDNESPNIEGVLRFDMVFCGIGEPYIINPEKDHLERGERIQDEYEIKIEFKPSEHSNLPQVYETSGKIESLAKEKTLKLEDLHINPSKSACLCLNTKESDYLPNGFNLPDYFNNLVIPFFYAQSYFRNTGQWRWGEYGHGMAGILESCLEYDATKENVEMLIGAIEKFCERNGMNSNFYKEQLRQKKIKGRNQCPMCKSGKRWEKCHSKSLEGLRSLKEHGDLLRMKV